MITTRRLTKRYGDAIAVDDLSFTVPSGSVTGFLGPNGAGKSTTMRMIVGLDRPSSGKALIDGRRFQDLAMPSRTVGSMLETGSRQPRLSAHAYLSWQSHASRIPGSRIDEVLEQTGLSEAARKKVGDFSLGMRQRLGIASALLGDPAHLILDEPINGLDPQGVLWARSLFRGLAKEGRTVFISSHLLSEMESVADRIIVIGQGRLIAESSMSDLQDHAGHNHVTVISPQADELAELLQEDGARVEWDLDDQARSSLKIYERSASQIGELAATHRITLHQLFPEHTTLEQAFIDLTEGAVEFAGIGHESPVAAREVEARDAR